MRIRYIKEQDLFYFTSRNILSSISSIQTDWSSYSSSSIRLGDFRPTTELTQVQKRIIDTMGVLDALPEDEQLKRETSELSSSDIDSILIQFQEKFDLEISEFTKPELYLVGSIKTRFGYNYVYVLLIAKKYMLEFNNQETKSVETIYKILNKHKVEIDLDSFTKLLRKGIRDFQWEMSLPTNEWSIELNKLLTEQEYSDFVEASNNLKINVPRSIFQR